MKVVLAVLLTVMTATAAHAEDEIPRLTARRDPMWNGLDLQLNFVDQQNSNDSFRGLTFQGTYAGDNGFGVSLTVPGVLMETNPSNTNERAPRIGGGPTGRTELDALARVFGDAQEYLSFSLGLGFPFQTDPVLRNSATASWMFAIGAQGRVEADKYAFEGRISDDPIFPQTNSAGAVTTYSDGSNLVIIALTAIAYPNTALAPFLGYSETLARGFDVGVNQGQGILLNSRTSIGRTRTLSIGADVAPKKPTVLISPEINYFFAKPSNTTSSVQLIAKFKVLF